MKIDLEARMTFELAADDDGELQIVSVWATAYPEVKYIQTAEHEVYYDPDDATQDTDNAEVRAATVNGLNAIIAGWTEPLEVGDNTDTSGWPEIGQDDLP